MFLENQQSWKKFLCLRIKIFFLILIFFVIEIDPCAVKVSAYPTEVVQSSIFNTSFSQTFKVKALCRLTEGKRKNVNGAGSDKIDWTLGKKYLNASSLYWSKVLLF